MALVLGMNEGQSVYVGATRVTLDKVFTPSRFVVLVEKTGMDEKFEITDQERTMILPRVYAQAGRVGSDNDVKIAIDAPRDVVILRERLYNK